MIKSKTNPKNIKNIKKGRGEGKNTHNIQENTIPYRMKRLKARESTIRSHSFPPFPFLSTPFITHYPLVIIKPLMTTRG